MPDVQDFQKVVTRFAPSPTGLLHAGNYRTAIFSYLFARQHKGKFILRIEDTDRERSKKEYEDNIVESLKWLDLEYDEFYRQSDRVAEHTAALKKLIEKGSAYISKEEAKDGSKVMRELVRFKNPGTVISFDDLIRGTITIDTKDLGDFVIAKNINEPLFHLAVIVDDAAMGVTHIVRGEDHIANTPRQLLIYDALGYPRPHYAHLPLVLDASRAKLSKRRGALPLTYYRDEGYLPDALLNFLAMIGWNPGTEKELFTHDELIAEFAIERIQKSGAFFNIEKLEWINKEHMKRLPPEEQCRMIGSFLPKSITQLSGYSPLILKKIAPLILERITHFGEVAKMADAGELHYFFETPQYSKEKLFWKDERDATLLLERLQGVKERFLGLPDEHFAPETLKNALWDYAEKEGRGQVLWPTRYALSGRDKSPDPFQLASILGKNETIERLNKAIEMLK